MPICVLRVPLLYTRTETLSPTLLISVLETSKATGFPIRKWIQWILRGLIPSEPELNADYIKGIPYESIAPSIFIPMLGGSYLPRVLSNLSNLPAVFSWPAF